MKDYLLSEVAAIDVLQEMLEDEISNFEITQHEDLYDEENDKMLRAINFNRGTKDFYIVVDMYGRIAAYEERIPRDLLIQISNAFIGLYAEEEAKEY